MAKIDTASIVIPQEACGYYAETLPDGHIDDIERHWNDPGSQFSGSPKPPHFWFEQLKQNTLDAAVDTVIDAYPELKKAYLEFKDQADAQLHTIYGSGSSPTQKKTAQKTQDEAVDKMNEIDVPIRNLLPHKCDKNGNLR